MEVAVPAPAPGAVAGLLTRGVGTVVRSPRQCKTTLSPVLTGLYANSSSYLSQCPGLSRSLLLVPVKSTTLRPSRSRSQWKGQRIACSAADVAPATANDSAEDDISRENNSGLVKIAKAIAYVAAAIALGAALRNAGLPGSATALPFAHTSGNFVGGGHKALASSGAPVQVLQIGWAGLAAGCLHTLTGPDHLAALAPLTIGRSKAASLLLGALWGGGHGTGQMLLGLVFLLFKDQLQQFMPMLARWSGTMVGVVLILIGAHGIREAQELAASGVLASEDGDAAAGLTPAGFMESGKSIGLATFGNGVVFGLQPDALMVVLPALALPTRTAAAVYCGTFLIGTMAAMGSYTACIGAASRAVGKRMPWITQRLSLIAGVIAIVLGGVFVAQNALQIGV